MPRNGSGTFTLVSGNPVVTGTTIESTWANTTLSDIATTLTDSLSRSGQGGMTAALRLADGTQSAPGVAFANETQTGFYRAGTGEVWAVVQGAQTMNLDATGVTVPSDKTTSIEGTFVFNETGADKDARFEGDTDANLLFIDASTDRVGVGTNAPATKLTVRGATQNKEVALRWERATDGAVAGGLGYFYDSENSLAVGSVTNHPFKIITNDVTAATFDTSGNLGLGVTPSASWGSGFKALQIGAQGQGIAVSTAVSQVWLSSNGVFNGTNWLYFNSASAGQYQIDGNAHKWFTASSGTAGNAISFTQVMTLDASSNLTLKGNYIIDDTGTGIVSAQGTGASSLALNGRNAILFTTGGTPSGTERARITSGGDLLVGTTTTSGAGGLTYLNQGATGFASINNNNAGATGYVFSSYRRSSIEIGSVTQNGTTAVLFNTTSDRRLKNNIVPAPSASAVIDAIEIVSHDWKSAPDEHVTYGVIAQDLALVAPQAVLQGDDGDEIEKTWGVDYSKLVPMLIKEIQTLRARVAALEAA